MGTDQPEPTPEPSGNQPPPRPPRRTAVGLGPDDDDDPNDERIKLPPKPSTAPIIKLPTHPPGGPAGGPDLKLPASPGRTPASSPLANGRASLKPRLSTLVAMILGGTVLGYFGIAFWILLGGYVGLIPGVFGVIGVFWVLVGVFAVARRSQRAVIIDGAGIELPAFRLFERDSRRVRIRREDIVSVSKHESLRGRMIQITTTGGAMLFQARHYCELDEFLSHCRKHGLPVA